MAALLYTMISTEFPNQVLPAGGDGRLRSSVLKSPTTSVVLLLALFCRTGFGQTPFHVPEVDTRFVEVPGEDDIYYSIFIPKDYVPTKPVPLVLGLHFGGNPEGAGRAVLEMLLAPALEDLGAIIVAPDSKGGGWDSEKNDHAVNLLLGDVFKNFSIDRKRIAVAGFSMGGIGAWTMALKYPDRFSAVIPVAGAPPASLKDWKLPVFAVHSQADETVPIEATRSAIATLRKSGVRAELVELKGIPHHQTYRFADGLKQAVPWLKNLWK
jgi:predicted peptidase